MKHRMVVVAVCLAVVPMLLGAEIKLTKAIPNPGGLPGCLNLEGTFQIDGAQREVFDRVEGRAQSTTFRDLIYISVAAINGQNWTASWQPFRLPADRYDCKGRLYYRLMDDPPNMERFKDSDVLTRLVQ
ncbi:MAG: hypothetical protein C4297_06545 [Gemmataceae bacterium]